jgi:hypothetical protein
MGQVLKLAPYAVLGTPYENAPATLRANRESVLPFFKAGFLSVFAQSSYALFASVDPPKL